MLNGAVATRIARLLLLSPLCLHIYFSNCMCLCSSGCGKTFRVRPPTPLVWLAVGWGQEPSSSSVELRHQRVCLWDNGKVGQAVFANNIKSFPLYHSRCLGRSGQTFHN